jgi:hypothetical protein
VIVGFGGQELQMLKEGATTALSSRLSASIRRNFESQCMYKVIKILVTLISSYRNKEIF